MSWRHRQADALLRSPFAPRYAATVKYAVEGWCVAVLGFVSAYGIMGTACYTESKGALNVHAPRTPERRPSPQPQSPPVAIVAVVAANPIM